MNDTSPDISAIIQKRMMALSGEERFLMGVRMCEAARNMVLASLPTDITHEERRGLLFQRFQGRSLSLLSKYVA